MERGYTPDCVKSVKGVYTLFWVVMQFNYGTSVVIIFIYFTRLDIDNEHMENYMVVTNS